MDILIIIFVNVGDMPYSKRQNYMDEIAKRFRHLKHDRIQYFFMPSDRMDIKAIPIKCYLDGVVPETPDNIENLIEELREMVQKCEAKLL